MDCSERQKEKISVIIPVHNGQDCLAACVGSILSHPDSVRSPRYDVEIIIIDDGSTDDTASVCDKLRQEHESIRVITMEDSGVSVARNSGLDMAAGDYVAFVDADDRLMPGALDILYKLITETGSDISGCGFAKWHDQAEYRRLCETPPSAQRPQEEMMEQTPAYRSFGGIEYLDVGLLTNDTRCWGKLYRREAIAETRFPPGLTIGEDVLFLLAVLIRSPKISVTDRIGYAYFQNPAGAILRPFEPSHMDQIACWQSVRSQIAELRPELSARAATHLIRAVMETAGKSEACPAKERKRHRQHIDQCGQSLAGVLGTPGAMDALTKGFRLQIWLCGFAPRLYVGLQHRREKWRPKNA